MELNKFFADLLIVIVLFNKKPEQSVAYASIHTSIGNFPSFPEIFIYDNSPEASSVSGLSITYLHDPGNGGVSKAYNEALTFACRQQKKWMLFLDQDTTVESGLFWKFAEAIAASEGSVAFVPSMKDRKGLVSPFYFRSGRGMRIKLLQKRLPLSNYRFINSGLLIRTSAVIKAGGYDEAIPLDFSDISFGERLRQVTEYFEIIDIELNHSLSQTENLPLKEALARYHFFFTGAVGMGKNSGSPWLYSIRALLHASHLSFRYRNLRFFRIFIQRALYG